MKKCLITGCEGFIGSHLADFLLEKKCSIYGMVYGDTKNIDHLRDKIYVLECDLLDSGRVEQIINMVKPDYVFHLAAQSLVTRSWENPEETLTVNVLGTLHLLDGIRKAGISPMFQLVGSSSVYGPCSEEEMPIKEEKRFQPTSSYAVSKVCEEMLGLFYWQVYDLNVVRVRPFNMTGPRKIFDACSDFSSQVVEVEKGIRDSLDVGKLDTVRDFTDGRDAVRALWLLAEKGLVGEVYNLCSGTGHRMREVLRLVTSLSGREIEVRQDSRRIRPFDDPAYVGDNSKLRRLGWEPKIPLEKTLCDMLDYWRANLQVTRCGSS